MTRTCCARLWTRRFLRPRASASWGDRAMLDFLRRVARQRGLIILTDPDGAGFLIRNYLKGALPRDRVLHAYVPDIAGKEAAQAAAGERGASWAWRG